MPLSIVYAGTPEFAVPALEAVFRAGHEVRAVYTQPDRPAGRGRVLTASAVKRRALELGLPVRQPPSLREAAAAADFADLGADIALVAAYGLMLPAAVLEAPRLGCLNLHASILPRWRGAAPIQRAILAGDALTGVSMMRMDEGLDTGPVYVARTVTIGARETALGLTERLATLGAEAALETLRRLEAGECGSMPQASEGVTYARKLEKREAPLDWSLTALELDRQVRAFVPWPVAETVWAGAQLRVHACECLSAPAGASPGTIVAAGAEGLDVATAAGVLRLTALQLAGRGIVTGGEFVRAEARRTPLIGQRLGVSA